MERNKDFMIGTTLPEGFKKTGHEPYSTESDNRMVTLEIDKETLDGAPLKEDLSNYNAKIYNKPSVTTDICICRYHNKSVQVLLIKRKAPPFKDCWAIPGGFLDIPDESTKVGQENLEETAARELKEETGLEGIFMEQLKSYGDPNRDPRPVRVITVAYYALVSPEILETKNIVAASDAKEYDWFDLKNPDVDLAFDHAQILGDLYKRLSGKVMYSPIAFELLNKKFTWADLKFLYEFLLGKQLLESNFRRKIKSMYTLESISEEVKQKTGRPAKLLRFVSSKEDSF